MSLYDDTCDDKTQATDSISYMLLSYITIVRYLPSVQLIEYLFNAWETLPSCLWGRNSKSFLA